MPDHKINDTTIIRIQKNEFPAGSGKYYLDIRRFYWASEGDPGWRPTRKGISIPYSEAPKILELAQKIIDEDQENTP
jgi:hypothetical protein